jgi:hypothetical protein
VWRRGDHPKKHSTPTIAGRAARQDTPCEGLRLASCDVRTSKGFPLVVISVSWRARLVRPYEAKQLGKTCTAGKTDFQLATQSTRRKRQQMRAHPKDKSAS